MKAGPAARLLIPWSKIKLIASKTFTTKLTPATTAIKYCKGWQAKASKCQITFWINKGNSKTAETASWVHWASAPFPSTAFINHPRIKLTCTVDLSEIKRAWTPVSTARRAGHTKPMARLWARAKEAFTRVSMTNGLASTREPTKTRTCKVLR